MAERRTRCDEYRAKGRFSLDDLEVERRAKPLSGSHLFHPKDYQLLYHVRL